ELKTKLTISNNYHFIYIVAIIRFQIFVTFLYFWQSFEVYIMSKIIENKIIEAFKGQSSFDRKELYHFYLDFEPDLKESTFSWRIYDLKKKDIIKTIGRGLYVISYKPKYKPVL